MAFIMLKLLLRVQLLIDTVAMDREDIFLRTEPLMLKEHCRHLWKDNHITDTV